MDEIMTATELKCAVGWQLCEKTVCGHKTLKRTLCLTSALLCGSPYTPPYPYRFSIIFNVLQI